MDIGPGITIGPGIQYYNYVAPPGQVEFTTVGTTTWTVPQGVDSISAVCVGGGGRGFASNSGASGGRGGDLRYATYIAVTPGEVLSITVGSGGTASDRKGYPSSINRGSTELLSAAGGGPGLLYSFTTPPAQNGNSTTIGGTVGVDYVGGGDGGISEAPPQGFYGSGGGGAAGYSGSGGTGRNGPTGTAGSGGGGGGGCGRSSVTGYAGGGVQIYGQFSSGQGANAAPAAGSRYAGGQGSRPDGATTLQIITYGGGSGGIGNGASTPDNGGQGAVRIIWGEGRGYPSTNTGDV